MKIGIIGTGNMGTILSEAFLEGKAAAPADLIVANRTKERALALQRRLPGILVADTAEEVIGASELVFLCAKPMEILQLLVDNRTFFRPGQCAVSITSPLTPAQMEDIIDCSCARVIPSITNRALAGISLITYGDGCDEGWQRKLHTLFSSMSVPVIIDDSVTRAASDIVSCGPAFFSYLARRFIEGAVEKTGIDENTATHLTEKMLVGLGELLKKEIYTLPALEEKVCVKGGITGVGIEVLEAHVGEMFEDLFSATHRKFAEEVRLLKENRPL